MRWPLASRRPFAPTPPQANTPAPEPGEAGGAAERGEPPGESAEAPVALSAGVEAPEGVPALASATLRGPLRQRWVTRGRVLAAVVVVLVVGLGAAYTEKARFTAQAAEVSRSIIGDENTARVEGWYFRVDDRIQRLKYRLFGGETNPFEATVRVELIPHAEPITIVYARAREGPGDEDILALAAQLAAELQPRPMVLPQTQPLRDRLEAGEGVWTTAGLPRSNPNDVLMAKTFIRPDRARPYALAGVLLVDRRRARLTLMAGTAHPGGDRGVRGAGAIPAGLHKDLLVAWNGGFQGPHGNYGMFAGGKVYRPMRNGLATVAVFADGSVKMGQWGRDLAQSEGMVAARQNAVLLVDNGEVSRRVAEGNDTWGYVEVNSAEFITWRSAIGLTKDGDLLVAAGNALSAETLARALWAAGAQTAMQLDINSPYVLTSLFGLLPDGSLKAERFMDNMPDSPMRFLRSQERDFMYLTFDESAYRNTGP